MQLLSLQESFWKEGAYKSVHDINLEMLKEMEACDCIFISDHELHFKFNTQWKQNNKNNLCFRQGISFL